MKNSGQATSIVRRTLFESDTIGIGSFEAHPESDVCGAVEYQTSNALVLPFAGVFAKHETPGRHVIGTPSHAVFIAADTPYRIGFPGAIGDQSIVLRFDDALASDLNECRRWGEPLASHGLLPADAMMRRDRLRHRLADAATPAFEIETLGLELLDQSRRALRGASQLSGHAARLRRLRAVERVKEAVAVAPADAWSIARLANIASLSPFHLCHVFRELAGTSIYDYVQRERLARTLGAVLDGSDDITAIALDAGFASHSHFTARFRRFFGCTPAALRRGANASPAGEIRKIMIARARRRP